MPSLLSQPLISNYFDQQSPFKEMPHESTASRQAGSLQDLKAPGKRRQSHDFASTWMTDGRDPIQHRSAVVLRPMSLPHAPPLALWVLTTCSPLPAVLPQAHLVFGLIP